MTPIRAGILILGLVLAIVVAASAPGPSVRAANQSFTLIGHQTSGWGSTVGNIQNPGPGLSVGLGDTVTLTLNATDNQPHTWFIDYDGDSQVDTGENNSNTFQGGAAQPITHTFVVTRAGSFTYRCSVHPATMTGTISIQAPPADNTLLIVGGVLVVIVIAAAAAVMMMRRKSKPPTQPPTQ